MKRFIYLSILAIALQTGCQDVEVIEEIYVYFNDFNSEDYTGLDSVYISEFDGSRVMGNFNNSGFSLSLKDLPEHDFIRLTFDLYIHDSWEGNTNNLQLDVPDHDAWIMEFDPNEPINTFEKIFYETTFSNGLCIPGWCFNQSYPNQFPFDYDARTEAQTRSTFGRCLWSDNPIGTSIYKFDKTFPHDRTETVIAFYDRLKREGDFPPLCEESWSLDNLGVSVIVTK